MLNWNFRSLLPHEGQSGFQGQPEGRGLIGCALGPGFLGDQTRTISSSSWGSSRRRAEEWLVPRETFGYRLCLRGGIHRAQVAWETRKWDTEHWADGSDSKPEVVFLLESTGEDENRKQHLVPSSPSSCFWPSSVIFSMFSSLWSKSSGPVQVRLEVFSCPSYHNHGNQHHVLHVRLCFLCHRNKRTRACCWSRDLF